MISIIVWGLAVIGAGSVVITIHYIASGQMAAESAQRHQQQYLSPEQNARVLKALSNVPQPSPEQVEARAIRQHQQLVQQYCEFIDELYDFGEDVANRRRDQP